MPENSYYAYVDKAEGDEENIFLEFHCLTINPYTNWPQMERQRFRNTLAESQVPAISLNGSFSRFRDNFNEIEKPLDLESEWYLLRTNTEQIGMPANIFADENDAGTALFVNAIGTLPPETVASLNYLTAIDDVADADEKEIERALNRNIGYQAEFIAVYNVGQGNCNAVCTERGMPLLYFDLGGGCYQNKHTYPAPLRFCFTYKPAIILSHWDTDHYESAKREPSYQAQTWIVPRQKFGPVHNKFFLQLLAAGSVLVWPAAFSSFHFNYGAIITCNHPDPKKKNHNGLAFMASITPQFNTIRDVLLPADAAYCYISGYTTSLCDGLVATHHGAEFDTTNSPVPIPPATAGAIAYSYGAGNTYHHPRRPAELAHLHPNRKDSVHGHIAISDQPLPNLPCTGSGCNIQLMQHY